MLYFKSDALGQNILVTCSELPDPQLVISKLGSDKKSIDVIARAKEDMSEEVNCGYTCLAQNPIAREKFASSSQIIEEADQGICLWEVNPTAWAEQADTNARSTAPTKRARTSTA